MTRNAPNTSKAAYHDKERQKTAKNHKEIILDFMYRYKDGHFTVRDLATCTRLGYRPTQKRVSDLKHEGRIKVIGTATEYDKEVESYQFVSFEIQKVKPKKSREQMIWDRIMTDYPLFYKDLKEKVNQDWEKQKNG